VSEIPPLAPHGIVGLKNFSTSSSDESEDEETEEKNFFPYLFMNQNKDIVKIGKPYLWLNDTCWKSMLKSDEKFKIQVGKLYFQLLKSSKETDLEVLNKLCEKNLYR